jgi:hypothetical protein
VAQGKITFIQHKAFLPPVLEAEAEAPVGTQKAAMVAMADFLRRVEAEAEAR